MGESFRATGDKHDQPTAEPPRNIIFVVDTSYTMNRSSPEHRSRLNEAQEIVNSIVARLPANTNYGLVDYSHKTGEEHPNSVAEVIKLGKANKLEILKAVSKLYADGNNPLGCALDKAFELADEGSNAEVVLITDGENPYSRVPERESEVIFITDGGDTCKVSGGRAIQWLDSRLISKQSVYPINVLRVSGMDETYSDDSYFEGIARTSGGAFYRNNKIGGKMITSIDQYIYDLGTRRQQASTNLYGKRLNNNGDMNNGSTRPEQH